MKTLMEATYFNSHPSMQGKIVDADIEPYKVDRRGHVYYLASATVLGKKGQAIIHERIARTLINLG